MHSCNDHGLFQSSAKDDETLQETELNTNYTNMHMI